ncbi:uncharacterized protein [Argopecten irradians]|uniref:uncharacterized protein n=1 Tax=Argopecten irradians TaxID=31199 RepID=UPI00371EB01E
MKHIEQLEGVQRKATKQLPGMDNLSYPERLKKLKLPTLSYRRVRGDMIETYKAVTGRYDKGATQFTRMWSDTSERSSTRTNSLKIFPQHTKTSIRKNSFSVRIASIWNNLPDHVVTSKTLDTFKNRLDNHRNEQEIKYNNYKENIS